MLPSGGETGCPPTRLLARLGNLALSRCAAPMPVGRFRATKTKTAAASSRIQCQSGQMIPVSQPTTPRDASPGAGTTAAAGGAELREAEVRASLIEQVGSLVRESGNKEPFDAEAWVDNWLRRPNHALGGAAPELYMNTPEGAALLSRLIGAMAAGTYM